MKKQRRIKVRRNLNADELNRLLRESFSEIKEHRLGDIKISLPDALMSGFALFSLKDPSLLAFDHREPENLKTIYGLESIPCDTQMRKILDGVEPETLRPGFQLIFRELQRGKELEQYSYLSGYYLLSVDGTGYFSSHKVHCENCLTKTLKNGEVLDAKQFWGLEDFMNVKQLPVYNAANLAIFMANLSTLLIRQHRIRIPDFGTHDLKAEFRGRFYAQEALKLFPESPDPVLID